MVRINLSDVFCRFILAGNVLVGALLLLAAYGPVLINPVTHPIWSCISLCFPIFLFMNCCLLVFWMFARIRYVLVSLLLLLFCVPAIRVYVPFNKATPVAELPDDCIKLVSYNSMMMSAGRLNKGKNAILEYLKTTGADIICLQEYGVYTRKNLLSKKMVDKTMRAYPYQKIVRIGGKHSSNKLACFSKYPILSARVIDYPSQYNGSVAMRLKIGKKTMLLINNHLESNKLTGADRSMYSDMLKTPSKENLTKGSRTLLAKLGEASSIRSRQADVLAKEIRNAREDYVVVCGDFNDSPLSYTRRVLASGMNDAFVESGLGMGVSFNQKGFFFRIDHILTSTNIQTYNCKIDRSVGASDHYPISCYLELKK